ncbi:MAG: hypothetical protein ACPGXK_00425, partial [Phycisphaerae bacterium]
ELEAEEDAAGDVVDDEEEGGTLEAEASLIAADGVRAPSSFFAQKHFRTAWIMLHRPNQEPTPQQLQRVVDILNIWNQRYIDSVLGRGTMSNVLTPVIQPGACDTVYEVRMETSTPPDTLVCENLLQPQCDPGDLESDQTYYWQVSATREDVKTDGPIWSFNTFCTLTGHSPDVCTIDARQPHTLGDASAREGLQTVSFEFDCETPDVVVEDFAVTSASPIQPGISGLFFNDGVATIELSEPVGPGEWTCVTYIPEEMSVCIGALPGDVDASAIVNSQDIRSLVLSLDGAASFPEFTTDLDRDGVQGPEDLLRLIDVINGGGEFDSWYGESLGVCPALP